MGKYIRPYWDKPREEKTTKEIEKLLDKMSPSNPSFEWQRGRWSVLCELLKSEFTDDLLKEIE